MMDQGCNNENENLPQAFSLKFSKEEWLKNERGAVFVMLGKKNVARGYNLYQKSGNNSEPVFMLKFNFIWLPEVE